MPVGRADRTLQHVLEPEAALCEVRRVLRPGGRLVVLEMLSSLHGEAIDDELAWVVSRRLWSKKAEAWPPHLLPLLLSRAGFAEVEIRRTEAVSASLDEADLAVRLRVSLDDAVACGLVDQARAETWLAELRAAEQRGAFALRMHFACISAVAV